MKPRLFCRLKSPDLLILFGLALLVRLLAALPQQQPNYMDAAYSYVNALNLATGRGFVEDFVWNYLDDPAPPPHPSHLYWMPLTSILAWLGMVVAGTSYRAAQLAFIVVSALLAPISYGVAHLVSGQRWSGWLAGLFAIFSGFYFPFWTAIDNFTPFAIAGSLALLLAWRGLAGSDRRPPTADRRSQTADRRSQTVDRRPPDNEAQMTNEAEQSQIPWTAHQGRQNPKSQIPNPKSQIPYLFAAGACAGLAHLARADGPLLLVAIILVYFFHVIYKPHPPTPPQPIASGVPPASRSSLPASRFPLLASPLPRLLASPLPPLFLGYLFIMAPWFWRNWLVAGVPLPTAGSQTIWLSTGHNLFSSYSDLFSYGRELSARTFLAQGLGPILQGRWWVLTANLQTVLAVWGLIFLAPLALVGFWRLRDHLLMQLAGLYGLLLFLVMSLVFAFPGALGGLFHSGGALLPYIYAASLVGLDSAVDWAAARRRHWRASLARRVFGLGLVAMAVTLSGFIYYGRVLKNETWNKADGSYPAVAAWVAHQNPVATVMINNPPAYRYHGGGLSVAIPNENLETTLQVARRYQVDYLILEPNHPEALTGLYNQTLAHPQLALVKTFGNIYIFKIVNNE